MVGTYTTRLLARVRNRTASSRQHHESAELDRSQRLVTVPGLDGKTIFPLPYRRRGAICLDIPFYRTLKFQIKAGPPVQPKGCGTRKTFSLGKGGPPAKRAEKDSQERITVFSMITRTAGYRTREAR